MTIQANFPAIKPSLLLDFANTKQLDSRITYTRASTASFYNGVTTAKAEENLFTYSQEFDNVIWLKTNSTVTANSTTAPDGTSTADTLFETTTNGQHRVFLLATVTGTYTISTYAKAAGRDYVALWFGGVDKGKFFYIPAGGSGSVGGNFVNAPDSASITYVGNDWYRCSVTVSGLSGSAQHINACLDATTFSYAGDVTKGVHLWGAQLEQRSAVSAYTATTTQAITNYIPVLQTAASGVARFDNNPTTGESLGLLIEESRTNLATYSSDLSNAAWSKVQTTVTSDTVVAPDGTLTGDKLVESTATSAHYAINASFISVTSGTAYTISLYAKAGGRNFVVVEMNSAALGAYAWFDLANGVVGTTGGSPSSTSITSVGNGWYRITISKTATSSTTSLITIYTASVDNATSYTGNGFSGVFLWGIQYEAGAFATSYIPTVASQVTRAAEDATMTSTNFSSWYNQAEGTVFMDAQNVATGGYILDINDGTAGNNSIQMVAGSSGGTSYLVVSGGATSCSLGARVSVGKYANGFKVNDFAISINSGTVSTDTSGTVPLVTQLKIGRRYSDTSYLNGTIKKIAYYPLKATSAQLQALTS